MKTEERQTDARARKDEASPQHAEPNSSSGNTHRRGSCARHQTPPNGRQMSEDEEATARQRSPSGDARAQQNEERQNQPHRSAQNITRHRRNRCRETERRPSTHRRREGSKGRGHEARRLTRDEDERAMKERAKNEERQQPQSVIELESTRHPHLGGPEHRRTDGGIPSSKGSRDAGRRQHGARD